jgi:hypothetical protein
LAVDLLVQGGLIVVIVAERRVDLGKCHVSTVLVTDLLRRRAVRQVFQHYLDDLDIRVV